MSMLWCKELLQSISNDSKWKASIFFPSSHAAMINNQIEMSINVISHYNKFSVSPFPEHLYNRDDYVDIVQLFNSSLTLLPSVLQNISSTFNYPNGAIFHFENYSSLDDKDRLIQDLKRCAYSHGTILVSKKGYNKKPKTMKYYSHTLVCNHYGCHKSSSKDEKEFVPDMVQQCNTIIQPHHSASSIRGRSRSSVLKRAHISLSESDDKMKRLTTKQCQCLFQITIMYDHDTFRWFLKSKKSKSLDSLFHHNHIYISPDHLTFTKTMMSDHIKSAILTLFDSGTPISNIVNILKYQYSINVNYSTLFNIRSNQIIPR